ncbi:MAG TPA: UDP-glucose/GDP-mannose dehydrogenase family protein [Spirochaetota bacterium]|nr:UDP-glucose/GDP-mannose dehydrogenase family protein [Spirochaetota bacterium]HOS33781.1 UDP-glucose/GDP-mannose dehydrogenase family protein [Spirochaetota bacterium]HOS56803.1 UDP-glucose/GDP-mannose dehydrogenase family protein [Spirochaetota bacterium]HPK61883.1 UDP-glucose/GDP-mannose dehydrogenase family protein [Spirochaetota bacterium]HQF79052.1 UDP-glucose/GDP-mannose dehydrogenase family protein [Spirochaetota bacterium]
MKITVIGAGYVGLVTASCFADLGNEVICVEKIESKIEKLRKGISPIYEPGLDIILKRNIENKRISFTLNMTEGINFSDIIFFCVGTPQGDDGKADLSQIEEASRQIAENLTSYKLIIEKSTVPVNTHQWIKKTILRYAKNNVEFDVASNPEFLREGSAIKDFLEPDRIVVGTESNKARNLFRELYKPFTDQDRILIFTTPATAELIKHASNSFLSLKISYINMVSDLCEKVGADVSMVAEGMGLDKRIGRSFLNAGIGYGGSCFPKDVKAFIKMAKDNGVDFSILEESEKVNKNRRVKFIEKIENILWINKDKNITIWGLSFKPNTDDIREAPSIDIVKQLNSVGANLRLYDPEAAENFKNIFPESDKLRYFSDMYGALEDSDALIILTEWEHFISANLEKIKNTMKLPIIIDGRNIFDGSLVESYGFEYYSIGR